MSSRSRDVGIFAACLVVGFAVVAVSRDPDASAVSPTSGLHTAVPSVERLSAAGDLPWTRGPSEIQAVEYAPEPEASPVAAAASASLRVRVVERGENRPVGRVQVACLAGLWREDRYTDEAGQAEFSNVPSGMIRCWISRGQSRIERLSPGEAKVLEVVIEPGFLVTGSVQDADGNPVRRAEVLISDGVSTQFSSVAAQADEHGAFTLDHVQPGQFLAARMERFGPGHPVMVLQEGGNPRKIDLILRRSGGAIRGRVVTESGDGLVGATIRVRNHGHAETSPESPAPDSMDVLLSSGADGWFQTEEVLVGKVACRASARGFPAVSTWTEVVGGGTAVVTIVLVRAATVRGRAEDAEGAPLSGVEISAWRVDNGEFLASVRSNDEGAYVLGGLPAENVRLVATGNGHDKVVHETGLSAGLDSEWNPRLPVRCVVFGTLVDPDGKGLQGWRFTIELVRADGPAHSESTSVSGVAGEVAIVAERQGIGVLRVFSPGQPDLWPAFVLEHVQVPSRGIRIVVPRDELPTATVTGHIAGLEPGYPSCQLWLRNHARGALANMGRINQDGRFTWRPIPRGHYEVLMQAQDSGVCVLGEILVAGDTPEIAFHASAPRLATVVTRQTESDRIAGSPTLYSLAVSGLHDESWNCFVPVEDGESRRSFMPGEYHVAVRRVDAPETSWRLRLDPGQDHYLGIEGASK